MKIEDAINRLNDIKNYYNDKNEESYVGFDDEDNKTIDYVIEVLKIWRYLQ